MTQSYGQPGGWFFLDSHCHLDDAEFASDRAEVIERARAAGVRTMMTIGGAGGPDTMAAALQIADDHDGIFAAAGIHPHEAIQAQEKHYDQLREFARHQKFLAVGEIGLDYHYDHSPREVQKNVLIRQLELAREVRLPIVIHCREAWADLAELIGAHWKAAGLGGILHCFGGERTDAHKFLDWGFLVSFAGNLTFKKAENLREVAKEIPMDRLLTETDSPYLAPVPIRGKRNEPANVVEVTRTLAGLYNLAVEEMGEVTIQNFSRFFRIP
ncbi:MAG TPA: TatD family hydrolase [Terriglobia bacterium]|nr:TatD family hydrolase [Terriglobia bacterium]